MASNPNGDSESINEAWRLVTLVTNELADALGYGIIEWAQRHSGAPEAYIRGWAGIAEVFELGLQNLLREMEYGARTSQEAVAQARKLVREIIHRLRPSARLHRHIFPPERLDAEVEISRYVVAADRLSKGLRQLLQQYDGDDAEDE